MPDVRDLASHQPELGRYIRMMYVLGFKSSGYVPLFSFLSISRSSSLAMESSLSVWPLKSYKAR